MSIGKLFRQLLPILLVGQLIYACEKLPAIGTDSVAQEEGGLDIGSIIDVMNAGTWMGIQPLYSGEDSCYWQIRTQLVISEVDTGYQCNIDMELMTTESSDLSVTIIRKEIDEPWVVERTMFEDVGIRGGEEGFLITSLEEEGASIRLWFDGVDLYCYSESTLVPLYKKYFQEELYAVSTLQDDMVEREQIHITADMKSLDDCVGYGFLVNTYLCPGDLYVVLCMNPHPEYPKVRVISGARISVDGHGYYYPHFSYKESAEDVNMGEGQFNLNHLEIDVAKNEIRGYLEWGDEDVYMRICYYPSTDQVVLYWTPGEYYDMITGSIYPYCPDELCIQLYQESYQWSEEDDIK